MPRYLALLTGLCLSCGTLSSSEDPDRRLPNNRTGPFRELTLAESGGRECITDFNGALDEPSALARPDGTVILYATRTTPSARSIARVTLLRGLRAMGDPVDTLRATHPWESGAVSSPSVVRTPEGYAMAYAAGGAIGLAQSPDGISWTTSETPWFTGDPSSGELTAPVAPALVLSPDGGVVLAYESAGAIFLARGRGLNAPLERVDGDPRTALRDPIVTAARTYPDAGLSSADLWVGGSVGEPSIDLEERVAGRALWRVYFTAGSLPVAVDGAVVSARSIGMAASFDGRSFQRARAPVFTLRADANPSGPSFLPRSETLSVLYVGARCELARLRRGVKVIVAPASSALVP